MILSCAAFGCANHNKMENKPGFYRFPNNDVELRKKWIQACRRKNKDGSDWKPTSKHVYIYGKQIIGGKPMRDDPTHPDYIPSLFVYNKTDEKSISSKVRRHGAVKKREALKRKLDVLLVEDMNSPQAKSNLRTSPGLPSQSLHNIAIDSNISTPLSSPMSMPSSSSHPLFALLFFATYIAFTTPLTAKPQTTSNQNFIHRKLIEERDQASKELEETKQQNTELGKNAVPYIIKNFLSSISQECITLQILQWNFPRQL